MYEFDHLVRIGEAAQAIVTLMDTRSVLDEHQPGYLVVMDDSPRALLSVHIGTYGHLCDEALAATARGRCLVLRNHPHNYETHTLTNGTTSSDVNVLHAGAVAASNLAIGYASRDGGSQPFGDEAVTIMIAIKAGLLPKSTVKKRYNNRSLREYNQHLRLLMDTLTWTD